MLKVGFYDGDLVLIVKLRRIFLILIPADYPLEKKDKNHKNSKLAKGFLQGFFWLIDLLPTTEPHSTSF